MRARHILQADEKQIHAFIYTYVYVCASVYEYMYVCMYVCIRTHKTTRTYSHRYEGEWRGGMLCGQGTYYKADGKETIEGNWNNNTVTGMCEHREPEGRVYVGMLKDGLRHGRGRLTLPGERIPGSHVYACLFMVCM